MEHSAGSPTAYGLHVTHRTPPVGAFAVKQEEMAQQAQGVRHAAEFRIAAPAELNFNQPFAHQGLANPCEHHVASDPGFDAADSQLPPAEGNVVFKESFYGLTQIH